MDISSALLATNVHTSKASRTMLLVRGTSSREGVRVMIVCFPYVYNLHNIGYNPVMCEDQPWPELFTGSCDSSRLSVGGVASFYGR
jgi:hypothetical protein